MRLTRLVTLLLATTLALGPTLLDRCLISCQDEASASPSGPTCHEHQGASGETSLHGVTDCSHDHDGIPADSVTDARANAARFAAVSCAAVEVFRAEPPLTRVRRVDRCKLASTLVSSAHSTPLRL